VLVIDRSIVLSISIRMLTVTHLQSSMSSLRSHRIVIASLFLPTTAVLGESGLPTPERPIQDNNTNNTISAVTNRLVVANIPVDPTKSKPLKPSINTTTNHNRQLSASGPLKSIVDDLKDKVHTSVIHNGITTLIHHLIIRADMPRHPIVHRLTKPPLIHSQNSPGSH